MSNEIGKSFLTSSINPSLTIQAAESSFTDQEFTGEINKILEEGIKNNHDQPYVADKIFDLAQANPPLAEAHHLKDYQIVKTGVAWAYEMGRGNRPLALGKASTYDLFQWGVNVEELRRERNRPMTEEERREWERSAREAARGFAIIGGVALVVAGGVELAPLAAGAWRWLMGIAATPQGQENLNRIYNILEGAISPEPPKNLWQLAGREGAKYVQETVKEIKSKDE